MGEEGYVKPSEFKVTSGQSPNPVWTSGLATCTGVLLFNSSSGNAGLAHLTNADFDTSERYGKWLNDMYSQVKPTHAVLLGGRVINLGVFSDKTYKNLIRISCVED